MVHEKLFKTIRIAKLKISLQSVFLCINDYDIPFFFYSHLLQKSPCKTSFVYTSNIKYGVRAAPIFGIHASLSSYHKDKKYVQAIICSVMLLSFRNKCMLENIC